MSASEGFEASSAVASLHEAELAEYEEGRAAAMAALTGTQPLPTAEPAPSLPPSLPPRDMPPPPPPPPPGPPRGPPPPLPLGPPLGPPPERAAPPFPSLPPRDTPPPPLDGGSAGDGDSDDSWTTEMHRDDLMQLREALLEVRGRCCSGAAGLPHPQRRPPPARSCSACRRWLRPPRQPSSARTVARGIRLPVCALRYGRCCCCARARRAVRPARTRRRCR
jgi:hypothetical protein